MASKWSTVQSKASKGSNFAMDDTSKKSEPAVRRVVWGRQFLASTVVVPPDVAEHLNTDAMAVLAVIRNEAQGRLAASPASDKTLAPPPRRGFFCGRALCNHAAGLLAAVAEAVRQPLRGTHPDRQAYPPPSVGCPRATRGFAGCRKRRV